MPKPYTKQHILSKKHINRFSEDGKACVLFKKNLKLKYKSSGQRPFYVKNLWSKSFETVVSNKLGSENKFNQLCERIVSGDNNLSEIDAETVANYATLWKTKAELVKSPSQNILLNGVSGSTLTKEQKRNIENKGGAYISAPEGIPSRFVNGMTGRIKMDVGKVESKSWTLIGIRSSDKGVVCPDYPVLKSGRVAIPITPFILLLEGLDSSDFLDVDSLNKQFFVQSHEFVFGAKKDIRRLREKIKGAPEC